MRKAAFTLILLVVLAILITLQVRCGQPIQLEVVRDNPVVVSIDEVKVISIIIEVQRKNEAKGMALRRIDLIVRLITDPNFGPSGDQLAFREFMKQHVDGLLKHLADNKLTLVEFGLDNEWIEQVRKFSPSVTEIPPLPYPWDESKPNLYE